jgi:outer membrane protein insertion porin family
MRNKGVWCLLLLILFFPSYGEAGEIIRVKGIEVRGNKKIEKATIISKIKTAEGDAFSPEKIQEDIKSIFEMGTFDDIKVETESFEGGLKVIFYVVEKSTIVEILFEGNKEIETEKLKERIKLSPGAFLDHSLIAENTERIRSYYEEKGYYHATILPIIKDVTKEGVSLTYQIDEGTTVAIREIKIEGNKAISEGKIKKEMKTKSRWILSWLDSSGIYKRETIKEDLDRIRSFYYNNGYIQVQVGEPRITLSEDRTKIDILIPIAEGNQFRIKEVRVKGNSLLSTEEIMKAIATKEGEVFSRDKLRKDITTLTDIYSDSGHALANISPIITPDTGTSTLQITLDINEGGIVKVGRINISGNEKTRDYVIRREMRLDEGDTFSTRLLRRSYERINNLNFFETVGIAPEPRPGEDVVDIHIKVKERPTGAFSVGGGYSSVDKLLGMAEITQGNLFGKGQYIRLKGEYSSRRTNYILSFREPYILGKPISAGTSIYRQEREYDNYKKQATGGSLSFGKSFTEFISGSLTYNYEVVKITDITPGASIIITEQEGKRTTSSVELGLLRDSRNSFLDPTRGSRNSIFGLYAGGPLGGDNSFYRTLFDSSWYLPLFWDTTFMIRGRLGYADGLEGKPLPLYERFYVGGINTVRGFKFGDVGPKDVNTGENIGGNKKLIFNLEYIFPLISDIRLKGVVFYDAGNAFDDVESIDISDLRSSVGGGFRWISPIGPLRVEWGYNLDPRPGEKRSLWEFTIGTFF